MYGRVGQPALEADRLASCGHWAGLPADRPGRLRPIRRAQERAEENRLSNVAEPIAIQTDFVTRPNAVGVDEAALQGLLTRQANRSDTRILLADARGMVVLDSDPSGSLAGERIPGLAREIDATA